MSIRIKVFMYTWGWAKPDQHNKQKLTFLQSSDILDWKQTTRQLNIPKDLNLNKCNKGAQQKCRLTPYSLQ